MINSYPKIRFNILTEENKQDLDIGLKVKAGKGKTIKSNSKGGRGFHIPRVSHAHKSFSASASNNQKQICVVRTSYRNSKDLHTKNLNYIQKEGKNADGEKAILYGSDSEEEYKKLMTDYHRRIIISPQSNSINLTLMTRKFVEELEKKTGYKFTWIAANHYDTDNHHTHLLLNGIDKNGKDISNMSKETCTSLMREIASDMCTNQIGYRNQTDIYENLSRMTEKEYFTKLDKMLESYMSNNTLPKSYMSSKYEILLSQRLQKLKDLDLCVFNKETQSFSFKENWQEKLKFLGKHNTYYQGMYIVGANEDNYRLHDLKTMGSIEGTLCHKFIRQKDSNEFAFVIQKKDGSYVYVPLSFYPKNCFVGNNLKIETTNNKIYVKNFSRK